MLVVEMGSITIDGISLTVAGREKNTFRVAIIPHTWKNTNLSDSKTGHISNIEFDMTGKYISRMIQPYLNKLSER
jgi:riboflavin synthase